MDFILKNDRAMILRSLRRRLDRDRYSHSISVAYTAASIAMAHGENIDKAFMAGLLHDYAKNMPYEEQLEFCRKHRIHLTDYEIANPAVIHGKVGALMVMQKFDIKDEEIIGALYNHVLGRLNMTMIEKIVFVADYIEPDRKELPNIAEVRKLAFSNINMAVALIYKNTINYVESKGLKINEEAIEAYKFYSGGMNDR